MLARRPGFPANRYEGFPYFGDFCCRASFRYLRVFWMMAVQVYADVTTNGGKRPV